MIIKSLSDDEALIVAMNLEKDGINFYNELSKVCKEKSIRDTFIKLCSDEKKHYELFKKTSDRILQKKISTPNINDEATEYLHALINTGIFSKQNKGFKSKLKKISEAEAISAGIQIEKDSIIFYEEAVRTSINSSTKKVFGFVIGEEKKHLIILTNRLMKTLKKA